MTALTAVVLFLSVGKKGIDLDLTDQNLNAFFGSVEFTPK
jgi:hypothetical protein